MIRLANGSWTTIWLKQVAVLSLCMGLAGAVLLAAVSLLLPPNLVDTGETAVGVFIGGMLTFSLYRVWGSSSCAADVSVLFAACLVVLGAILLRRLACGVLQPLSASLSRSCTPTEQRAAMYGMALSVSLSVILVWVVVRYWTWKIRL